ncbi:MAG: 50S ribosomal protein L35 [Planctomycetes bacterium]|nr:50S ribosomal protein L35 [Planctomycetota bacterium]
MRNKMKSHKGARKRLKLTASGKVRYRRSFGGHLMSTKSGDRKRRLHKPAYLAKGDARRVKELLG